MAQLSFASLLVLDKIVIKSDATRLAPHMGTMGREVIEVENTLVYSSKLSSLLPLVLADIAKVVSTSINCGRSLAYIVKLFSSACGVCKGLTKQGNTGFLWCGLRAASSCLSLPLFSYLWLT